MENDQKDDLRKTAAELRRIAERIEQLVAPPMENGPDIRVTVGRVWEATPKAAALLTAMVDDLSTTKDGGRAGRWASIGVSAKWRGGVASALNRAIGGWSSWPVTWINHDRLVISPEVVAEIQRRRAEDQLFD